MGSIIAVYHGTPYPFDRIDIEKGKPYKDFGQGFYVTRSRTHATNIALRNKRIENERYGRHCDAWLYTYQLNIADLRQFNVKEFEHADLDWVKFVLANRKSRSRIHGFDAVIGPTANDDTMVVINAYLDGLYGDIGSGHALNTLLRNIEAENLPGQIYFSSAEAVKLLIPKGQVVKL